MKIAIHINNGSFSDNWIRYCKKNNINFKIVNCYSTDIITQLNDCDGLMWHWSHSDLKTYQFAKQLTYSLEKIGKLVFPNSSTCWHFDDKIGQKYLLEAVDGSLVKSYVFYDKISAKEFIEATKFPLVFKLRGGAGSTNVKLLKNKYQALGLINTAFGKGFKRSDSANIFKDRILRFKKEKDIKAVINIFKGFIRIIFPSKKNKEWSNDKGYIYFQDYISGLDHDIRIIVIGKRTFAIKRLVRDNDFRASGSGKIIYDPNEIPLDCVIKSIKLAKVLETQCLAFDFVNDSNDYKLLEISYGFKQEAYLSCPGYWDENLNWHEGKFTPEDFMIEDFINTLIKQ